MWKQTLNINKSNFVLFHPIQKTLPKSVTLFINNQSLTEENSIRYLGIYIDSDLNWKSHINYIAKKVKHSIGILSKLHYCPDFKDPKDEFWEFWEKNNSVLQEILKYTRNSRPVLKYPSDQQLYFWHLVYLDRLFELSNPTWRTALMTAGWLCRDPNVNVIVLQRFRWGQKARV